jgi:hypothetical protein
MIIREPQVHATYYYLRAAPDDTAARRQDRHHLFVIEAQRILQSLAAWLAMPDPVLPAIPFWDGEPSRSVLPLIDAHTLEGRTNASAMLRAYALRNMLLLRVVIVRAGDYEETVWTMLDEALGRAPTAPSWLYTTRYWCAVAPRPPEELEQERLQPIRTGFGVLCLGEGEIPHLLTYPDARTEARAWAFLTGLAAELDWHTAQARYRLDTYANNASQIARKRQQALDQMRQSADLWAATGAPNRLRTLVPLGENLAALETAYADALADLSATRSAAQDVRALMAEYRSTLMRNGLWDAAPTVWEAQVANLAEIQNRIEADADQIDAALRRMDVMFRVLQTRATLLQGERERLTVYLIAGLGVALLAVLIADTSPARMFIRLLALAVVAGLLLAGWQSWLRSRLP